MGGGRGGGGGGGGGPNFIMYPPLDIDHYNSNNFCTRTLALYMCVSVCINVQENPST
jgi:hypothetical protein